MRITETSEICKIINGQLLTGTGKEKISTVCQDSRLAEKGCAFFAVTGANFDGHDYISKAVEEGATLLVIENKEKFDQYLETAKDFNGACILVENTINSIRDLASWYLESLNLKKIGVTGSCGKTSTRDMLYYVFSEKFKTHRNKGNFNTLVGVALTILDMPEDTEVAIFEMGMDGPGQIREIAELVKPDMAVITNIGVSHLENFPNRDGIFNAKMEIAEFFKGGETLIAAGDDLYLNHKRLDEKLNEILKEQSEKCQIFLSRNVDESIGTNGETCEIKVKNITENSNMTVSFDIEFDKDASHVELPVPGKHNAGNSSLALAAGKTFGISLKEGAQGLAKMNLTGKRLLVEEGNGMQIINDTYNANPLSMKAAIDILMSSEGLGGRKIAVLGDMYELGPDEIEYHRQVGEYAMAKADVVYSVGEMSKVMGADVHFDTKEELMAEKSKLFKAGDTILVKASNGMKLDAVVEDLLASN